MEHYYQDRSATLYHGDCVDVLKELDTKVDLVVTSPPYDKLRDYGGTEFNFDGIADALVSVLADGGVIVWVVNDATVKGSESGTSFRQALGFMDRGLNLHDTMIFEKNGMSWPSPIRYHQVFEYMFVFSKGKPKTFNIIKDRPNKYRKRWSSKGAERRKDGTLKERVRPTEYDEFGGRWNIWKYSVGGQGQSAPDYIKAHDHPAIFPYQLAYDHIVSWSNEGDTVMDPMAGSGTVLKAAKMLGRKSIGVEIHQPYCDIIVDRIQQQTLFE